MDFKKPITWILLGVALIGLYHIAKSKGYITSPPAAGKPVPQETKETKTTTTTA